MKFTLLSCILISSMMYSLQAFRVVNLTEQSIMVGEFGHKQNYTTKIMPALEPTEVPSGYKVDSDCRIDLGPFSFVTVTVNQQAYPFSDLTSESVITFQEDELGCVTHSIEEIHLQRESLTVVNNTSAKITLSDFLDQEGVQLEILPVQLSAGGKIRILYDLGIIDQMKIKGEKYFAQNSTFRKEKQKKLINFPSGDIQNLLSVRKFTCTARDDGVIIFQKE